MKNVLITGAGSGIGAAAAAVFSEQGWKVYLLGRTKSKLESVQKVLKSSSELIECDLNSEASLNNIERLIKNLSLDCLVNNAGIYEPAPFDKSKKESWKSQFQTNFFAAVQLTQYCWQSLIKNKGSIINVSSTLGLRPIENTSAYSASKAAMNNWTQTLALEAGPLGVRVNAICPGLTDTPIHFFHGSEKQDHQLLRNKLDQMQPLKRMGTPSDIAKAIYFAASDQSSWLTGALIPVDGGIGLTTRDP